MGDYKGFQKFERQDAKKRSVEARLQDYKEIYEKPDLKEVNTQAARCMDCGIPFCHSGCPLGNAIPDFNDAVYKGEWKNAYEILASTNNFPEFTGRICPAPCEASCVLGLNQDAVTIENIEKNVIEYAFEHNYVKPITSKEKTGKSVAIIGSGPAGLAAADQLSKLGHDVSVYEKSDSIGGLLRYGIPDFKLEKWVIDRRMQLMENQNVKFFTNCEIGKDMTMDYLQSIHDASIICIGAGKPRDVAINGRDANGVHFAMEFLSQSNKFISSNLVEKPSIFVKDKEVVVIGGGDTGADCVGTSHRQGAKSVTQLEVMYKPGTSRSENDPWPKWPFILRTSSSHEEGGVREWSVLTKEFLKNENNELTGIKLVNVQWSKNETTGQFGFEEVPNTERILACDYAFLAVGFLNGQTEHITKSTPLALDERGNIKANNYATSVDGIFTAGDVRRGQSLVVWAITEGREAASQVHKYLSKDKKGEDINERLSYRI